MGSEKQPGHLSFTLNSTSITPEPESASQGRRLGPANCLKQRIYCIISGVTMW